MLDIAIIGLNHKTASVDIRERLAFNTDEIPPALEQLLEMVYVKEVVLLSTCNRVEVIIASEELRPAIDSVKKFLSDTKEIESSLLEKSLYIHTNRDAIRHIFRVASSLDSMVIGEPQILGQIKDAFQISTEKKSSGVILNRLLHKTFFTAKRVRSETGVGDNAVSISYAAIELAKKIFGTLDNKKVLLIGAGEMAELAVEHLIRNKAKDIFVANRTFERGVELAGKFNGTPIRFDEIENHLEMTDIIISSTGSTDYVVRKKTVKQVLKKRKNRSIFFIDIAVPRDIDPGINRLPNSYVYDIDDLKDVIDENLEERNREAVKAERIIEEAGIHFQKWMHNLEVVPTIKALKKKINEILQAETKKTLGSMKNLTDEDREAVNRLASSIGGKILHDPILFLKNPGSHRDESMYLNFTRTIFNIDDE